MDVPTSAVAQMGIQKTTDHENDLKHENSSDVDGEQLPSMTTAMEKRLRTKIDFAICPMACLLYICCFIDRANIGMLLKS